MRLLELFGLPGVKNLNKFLKDYKEKQFHKITFFSETNNANKHPFCPIILGTNFIDQVNLLEKKIIYKYQMSHFQYCFYPLLAEHLR